MTSEEKAQKNQEKRQRQVEARDEITHMQWRPIDQKKECFIIDELPPDKAFLSLSIRRQNVKYIEIFTNFVADSLTDDIYASIIPLYW